MDKKLTSVQGSFFYASAVSNFQLVLVSCNDRRGVDYATTLTQALSQVLASYSMQRFFSNSHVLTPIPMHLIPIPIPFPSHGWSYSHSHAHL